MPPSLLAVYDQFGIDTLLRASERKREKSSISFINRVPTLICQDYELLLLAKFSKKENKMTREELLKQYSEAKKQGDKLQMAIITLKAYGLGYKKRETKQLEDLVADSLLSV